MLPELESPSMELAAAQMAILALVALLGLAAPRVAFVDRL